MRTARDLDLLDTVEVGDHVCWLVETAGDWAAHSRAFVADGALFGDKVLILGPWTQDPARLGHGSDVVVLDPRRLRDSLLGTVHREADEAGAQGFRALRVLARMDRIWPAGATARDIAEHELGMDALSAATGSIVVCSYQRRQFPDAALAQALSVHPHHGGTRATVRAHFRLYQAETEQWHVSGVVDADGAEAFRTALAAVAAQCPGPVRLSCEDLEFMDAAGMQALIQAARALEGRRILLSGVNETVRSVWKLMGYPESDAAVELVR